MILFKYACSYKLDHSGIYKSKSIKEYKITVVQSGTILIMYNLLNLLNSSDKNSSSDRNQCGYQL